MINRQRSLNDKRRIGDYSLAFALYLSIYLTGSLPGVSPRGENDMQLCRRVIGLGVFLFPAGGFGVIKGAGVKQGPLPRPAGETKTEAFTREPYRTEYAY